MNRRTGTVLGMIHEHWKAFADLIQDPASEKRAGGIGIAHEGGSGCFRLVATVALIGMLRVVTQSVSEEDRRFLADASGYCDKLSRRGPRLLVVVQVAA